jgi:hypothetical protein
MPRDARGVPIEVGDRAVYVSTGRYAVRAVVQVIEVKKKVKVVPLQQDRTFLGLDKEGVWADGYSIFLVERFKDEAATEG